MNREQIHDFSTRVSQASKSELIVILYEMTLAEIEEAKIAYKTEDFKLFDRNLKKAQRYVNELIAVLNYRYPLSYDLLSLYLYTNKRIITAIIKKNPLSLDSAEVVLKKLLAGFEGVSKQDNSGPVMQNSQQLYAGLTYGRGKLNETYLDPDNRNRGFIA
ncbi:MAG TPA: flagellar export chaperone FliS [Mobilitalea sp.]|nr:flagellar export chaperone FliS [Mobilitalea sp.]